MQIRVHGVCVWEWVCGCMRGRMRVPVNKNVYACRKNCLIGLLRCGVNKYSSEMYHSVLV